MNAVFMKYTHKSIIQSILFDIGIWHLPCINTLSLLITNPHSQNLQTITHLIRLRPRLTITKMTQSRINYSTTLKLNQRFETHDEFLSVFNIERKKNLEVWTIVDSKKLLRGTE